MRFTVSQSSLLKALSVVAKGMGTNSTLPLLSGIYIKAEEGTLEFQTNNLTITIRHRIPANVEEAGETVASGKMLTSIVKTLDDAAVTFDGGERTISISCEKSSFRLNTLNPADWPAFPEYSLEDATELPSELLSGMVDKVYKVTSKETTRPILQGILLTAANNTIRLVATDSYRLAVCDASAETGEGEFRTIVPGPVFHDVLSMPNLEEHISIGTTDSQVVFTFGNTTFISSKIEGNFPDYRQLLPSSCNTSVRIDVEAFAAALKRVSVVAISNASVRFDIDADGKVMRLSASSPDQGESTELLPVEVEGQSLSIALNYHYVFDCVNAVSDKKELVLELQSNMQPGIFKTNGKVNYLYMLMPVRM
ncbi:MAG: DNA polymerase III subunit beta [Olsenella sp.]|nr:DNA polymerase III subunit beta [Olsenella sp.]MCI1794012.1 DNA polymerase III subunit beta [Olsenella sp.]MCI1810446.1 DNA polymerase III subunit beta [Olsenella sp.]